MGTLSETPFRVYVVYEPPDSGPAFLGAADDVSLGELLLDLHKRGKIADDMRVGIMYRPERPGVWLVNPYARGGILTGATTKEDE